LVIKIASGKVPIFTSIPPRHSRLDAQGREIGDAHLRRCIASWHACGFEPVTVNSEAEQLHPLVEAMDLCTIRVPRDAASLTGRPHLYMTDLLHAAINGGDGRFYLVNADIELEMTAQTMTRTHALGPLDALLVRRTDYSDEQPGTSGVYTGGIDFFAGGAACLADIDFGALVFGMPWWDHFLPIAMLGRGARPVASDGITAWHYVHGGRWERKNHIAFGEVFMGLIAELEKMGVCDADIDRHLSRVLSIFAGKSPYGAPRIGALKAWALAHIPALRGTHLRRSLRDISALNETLFDRIIKSADA